MDHLLELFLHKAVVLLLLAFFMLHQHEVVGQGLVKELTQVEEVHQFAAKVGEEGPQRIEFGFAVHNAKIDCPASLLALFELAQQSALLYLEVGQIASDQISVNLKHRLIKFRKFISSSLRG